MQVIGFDNSKFILYTGMKLLAYKTHGQREFTNAQIFVVLSWNHATMTLQNLRKHNIIEIDIKHTTSVKPRIAMTVHKSQSLTFTEKYSIYEYKSMDTRMLYVALSRTTDKHNVNFCEIEGYTPYTGHIYSYEYNGQHYIGSTQNLQQRKDEHKNGTKSGNTKFKNAKTKYGFDNFNYKL